MDHNITEQVQLTLDLQRSAFLAEPMPTLAVRRQRLQAVLDMTRKYADELAAAISKDFGHRSKHETMLADVFVVESGAKHALSHLRRWTKPLKALPTAASPLQTVITSGVKNSATMRAISSDVAGVSSDGLIITRLPAASAAMAGPMAR